MTTKQRFYFRSFAAGASPDPAVYCPIEGFYDPDDPDSPVIWKPIDPAEWTLLAEFQTNSPNSTTFDPTIVASSGEYAWDLGDGTYLVGDKSVSHTYLTTATRTVKLYGKGTCTITAVDFNNDKIIGELDLSNAAFATLTSIVLHTNLSMTSVIFPSSITGTVTAISIYGCGIIGSLDLSMITNFSGAYIYIGSNTSLTSVQFASSITGTLGSLDFSNTGIIGTLDFSMFDAISGALTFHTNASMTGLIFNSSNTGTISAINIYNTGIIGTLDLSMFAVYSTTATVTVRNNASITGVIFPSSTIAGFIRTLSMYTNVAMGYVDTTKLRTGIASLAWRFDGCGWSAAIVNQVLVDIDSISSSGYTGRVINIGGTNADPDTTSGGYDGVTARNSLIAKGFTVTIT